jgi:hypothetical protein
MSGSRSASRLLASTDMRTLYLRNVPDDVAEALEDLARREGLSLNAFAVRQLTETSQRAKNAALLAALPETDLSREAIVRAVREGRDEP